MSTCRSCGAPIDWAMTPKGHRIPIDPEPVPDGNIILGPPVDRHAAALRAPLATVLTKDAYVDPAQARYTSHFATCPHADTHRRP